MCIPCVMCGACIDPANAESINEGVCPECGMGVSEDAVSCPNCYAFIYRAPKRDALDGDDPGGDPGDDPGE